MQDMGDGLCFDTARHCYYLNSVKVPSVTTILGWHSPIPGFVRRSQQFIDATRLGTEVHQITESLDIGEPPPPPRIGGSVEKAMQWRAWCRRHNAEIESVEIGVCSRKHFYAGKIDRLLKIGGVLGVWDIKTSQLGTYAYRQVTAYFLAAKEMGIPVEMAGVVSLHGDEPTHKVVSISRYTPQWLKIVNDYHKEMEEL